MPFEDAARMHIQAKEDTTRKVTLFPVVVPFGAASLWADSHDSNARPSLERDDIRRHRFPGLQTVRADTRPTVWSTPWEELEAAS